MKKFIGYFIVIIFAPCLFGVITLITRHNFLDGFVLGWAINALGLFGNLVLVLVSKLIKED